jgi:hypothetical protein
MSIPVVSMIKAETNGKTGKSVGEMGKPFHQCETPDIRISLTDFRLPYSAAYSGSERLLKILGRAETNANPDRDTTLVQNLDTGERVRNSSGRVSIK